MVIDLIRHRLGVCFYLYSNGIGVDCNELPNTCMYIYNLFRIRQLPKSIWLISFNARKNTMYPWWLDFSMRPKESCNVPLVSGFVYEIETTIWCANIIKLPKRGISIFNWSNHMETIVNSLGIYLQLVISSRFKSFWPLCSFEIAWSLQSP